MTDTTTPAALARNMIPAFLSMLAYALVLMVSLRLLAGGIDNRVQEIAVTLAPMVPAVLLCASIIGVIRKLDEMQRRLQLEAFSLAFAGTALITFSYGFLENVGFPKLSAFAVWPVMCGLWMAGLVLGHLRYK
ncbi:hypothetical protein [Hoeflea olei]|uniref:Uncharacterized protein n=1 Tax=Hoeflea olei TaxID=1480615 RepID=A0A1C1YXZ4_9HYPH|nr:hypothetical protein [Hoeflea olei]OCW58362.1 hypothetical protein AWJ14_13600 [Hoeflea olei]